MKNEDKEAFENWWWHREANHSTVRSSETWQAACEYKQKEIDNLEAENERLKEVISYLPKVPTQPYEKEMAQKIQKLQAENEKLRKVVFKNIQGHQFARMVLREACFHGAADDMTDLIDLCHASLKELDEKL